MASTVNILVTARNNTQAAFASLNAAVRSSSAASRTATQQMQNQYQELNRTIGQVGPRLMQARVEQQRLQRESAQSTAEMRRLEGAVSRLGSAASTQLRDQLRDAQVAAARAATALGRADANVDDLSRSLQRATNQAQGLAHALNRADRASSSLVGRMSANLRGAGQVLAGGLSAVMSAAWRAVPAQLKSVIVVAGVAMAATLAMAVGAALNGLLLTAVGGGILAAGVALAAKHSNVVQAAWRAALDPVRQDMILFATQFERPLVESAGVFRAAWLRVGSDVHGVFGKLAEAVRPLAEGVAAMAEEAMPGLRAAAASAVPLLKDLAHMLPAVGRGISEFFQSLSDGSAGATKGLRLVVMLLVGALITLGDAVEMLSKGFDMWTNAMEPATEWLLEILGTAGPLGAVLGLMSGIFGALNREGGGVARTLTGMTEASSGAGDGLYYVNDAARKATEEIRRLSDRLHGLISTQMEADEAMLAWRQALTAVTEAAKENGRTLDANTVKGQTNVGVILQAVQAAERKRQADIALAGGESATAAAVNNANATFRAQLDQLAALLARLGFTKAQIDGLLGSYRALAAAPNIAKTVTVFYQSSGAGASPYGQPVRVPGRHIAQRFGGVHYARQGLMSLDGQAGIVPGNATVFGFGEPGTGGEAFIARNAPRMRSLAIADQAARWHGGQVVPAGGGGASAAAPVFQVSAGSGAADVFATMFLGLIRTGTIRLTAGGQRVKVA